MPVPRQDQDDSSKIHLSRPTLTLDTQPNSYSVIGDPCAQSAPVGTRQEKGIAPMYQAGDRHCAKLAEMMNSPTWRSQNAVPYMGCYHEQHLLPPNGQDAQMTHYQKENANGFIGVTGLPTQISNNGRHASEVLHLGRCGINIEILDIQRFTETTEASSNSFIISAAIPKEVLNPHETFSRQRFEDDDSSDHENGAYSLQHASPPSEIQMVRQKRGQELETNAQMVMEQDDAIHSINHSLRSPNRRRQVTPDEQQRFRGLLDRLHQRHQQRDSNKSASFVDPAIIAFVPKKADPGTPTKRSTRNRSDSGYTSPSVYSRPNTREQSRIDREGSGSTNLDIIRSEHQNFGSHDSGFEESPSKNSILDPTAKEFSAPNTSKGSPVKQSLSIRPTAPNKLFEPSPQFQEMLGALTAPQSGPTMHSFQGTWYPPQGNMNNPPMAFPSVQHGVMPRIPPQWKNITGGGMASAAGVNPMGLAPFLGQAPGLGQPPGLGLAGLTTSSGLGTANVSGPFHQQLSNLALCCDPTHQAMSAFNRPNLPSVVPRATAPQAPGTPMPVSGVTNAPVPFIPKHVPKPKIPNTAGQQNWELMHELRRMNEPGYAQKCKEKQKKRYMKLMEKTGGQP